MHLSVRTNREIDWEPAALTLGLLLQFILLMFDGYFGKLQLGLIYEVCLFLLSGCIVLLTLTVLLFGRGETACGVPVGIGQLVRRSSADKFFLNTSTSWSNFLRAARQVFDLGSLVTLIRQIRNVPLMLATIMVLVAGLLPHCIQYLATATLLHRNELI